MNTTSYLPPELENRPYLSPEEFGKHIGRSGATVLRWGRKGWLRLKEFSPRNWMVPIGEVQRYMRGEMLEPRE